MGPMDDSPGVGRIHIVGSTRSKSGHQTEQKLNPVLSSRLSSSSSNLIPPLLQVWLLLEAPLYLVWYRPHALIFTGIHAM
jgi:hypothetical protein